MGSKVLHLAPESVAEPSAPFAGVGVVPGSGATPTPASPAPDTVPGSGAASGPEGAAEPSAPFAGVGVVPGSGATPLHCISGSRYSPTLIFIVRFFYTAQESSFAFSRLEF